MKSIGVVMCPHLKGSMEGSRCCITGNYIRDMEGFTIKLCMSSRYEACSLYMRSLQHLIEYGSYSGHCPAEG